MTYPFQIEPKGRATRLSSNTAADEEIYQSYGAPSFALVALLTPVTMRSFFNIQAEFHAQIYSFPLIS